MNLSWTRVQFPIPDGWEGSKKIQEWLEENCPGRWSTYSYQNPKSKSGENIMVIRFENKNDALMFKLKDGHKAWQE